MGSDSGYWPGRRMTHPPMALKAPMTRMAGKATPVFGSAVGASTWTPATTVGDCAGAAKTDTPATTVAVDSGVFVGGTGVS
jgi:hypothetical protein